PLYINLGTYARTNHKSNGSEVRHFCTGEIMPFVNTDIQFFPISHDTADPVGFRIHSDEGEIIHATDLGIADNGLGEIFNSARVILMDFNHDLEMLVKGPYPIFLKERIAGNKGHLSNESAAKFLAGLELPNLEALILAHMSRTNNVPTVARSAAQAVFEKRKKTPQIIAADQYRPRFVDLGPSFEA
ncbi:MAG TPA: MBL fold metallo-hydrolase, partial [candidate division Zixibacteria bacterium]|nr:MBL fold metallo-hydrolase [candidate division Zixibacteria bacterium]